MKIRLVGNHFDSKSMTDSHRIRFAIRSKYVFSKGLSFRLISLKKDGCY